jgi:glycosyltransferase involved in cell wall biosynthesis
MPIIEGQSIGRPVLTSNISPTREVASNAAVLVEPTSTESIRHGYEILLKDSETYIERGLENVKRFNLSRVSQEYFQIYQNVVK